MLKLNTLTQCHRLSKSINTMSEFMVYLMIGNYNRKDEKK